MRRFMLHIGYSLMPLLASIICVSCAKDIWEENTDVRLVRLTATTEAPIATRAATDIQSTTFDDGAPINVYIKTHTDNAARTGTALPNAWPGVFRAEEATGGINALTPDRSVYYPASDKQVSMYGIYPVTDTNGPTFSVKPDQTDEENYKLSDLMYASVPQRDVTDLAINLPFVHKMAKIIVEANADESEELTVESVTLMLRPTIGFTPSSGALGEEVSGTAGITISNYGAALVPPQKVEGGTPFVSVVTNGGTANFSLAGRLELESGREYTLRLSVTRRHIAMTANIIDWNTDIGSTQVLTTSDSGMFIEEIPVQTYDKGHEITPDLVVRYGTDGSNTLLKKDVTYKSYYSSNINVGTATAVAIGLGTYSNFAAVKTFVIQRATGSLSYPSDTREESYVPGKIVDFPLTKEGDGDMTFTSGDESVATVDADGNVTIQGVGSTTITATMAAKNYTGATAKYLLDVVRKEVGNVVLEYSTHVYTGKPLTPNVTVTSVTGEELTPDDYTVSYSSNINVGTVTVTITGIGAYSGVIEKQFSITKADCNLRMSNGNITIAQGSTNTRAATSDFGTVIYTSSDNNIATVSSSGTVVGIGSGQATITATIEDDNNYSGSSIAYQVTVQQLNTIYDTSGRHVFKADAAGTYRLEVYGAQGGSVSYTYNFGRKATTYTTAGGKGGYATGTVTLSAGEELYVYVGGAGGNSSNRNGGEAGYNGGGKGSNASSSSKYGGGGGGGATHISKSDGLLSAITTNALIVAGGGGGASYSSAGGSGGGDRGGVGVVGWTQLSPATSSSGYKQGLGEDAVNATSGSAWTSGYGSGGGGGGWYGGHANQTASASGSGSGGSGYTGGVSNGRMQTGQRSGDGYVRITYVP